MRLTIEQQRVLMELRRAELARAEAEQLVNDRALQCWLAGVPARRIASAMGVATGTVCKRFGASTAEQNAWAS